MGKQIQDLSLWTKRQNTDKRSRVKTIWINPDGKEVCSRKINKPEHPTGFCMRADLCQNGRCRLHGGYIPSGIASPHYKGKRYSKYLPARMLDTYQEELAKPDHLDLSDEIAVTRTRIGDLLTRADKGEAGKKWADALYWWSQFVAAHAAQDRKGVRIAMGQLDMVLGQGQTDAQTWTEVQFQTELLRKLTETQSKNEKNIGNLISKDKVQLVITALLDAVRQEVSDRETLAAISRSFQNIVGGTKWT